jgi:lysozyme
MLDVGMQHKNLLIAHEGYEQFPYKDSVGILSVAIGRNLKSVGIRYDEALYMLNNDIKYAKEALSKNIRWFDKLDEVRQGVLVNMCVNLGFLKLLGFIKMLQAVHNQQWDLAAKEMLDSKWATQVGKRAKDLARIMLTGEMYAK